MPTTNFERWQFWMKDFCSPQAFVDWGYYSLISTVLQRRVWIGCNEKNLHANQYNVLTGPAGVGKGMVLGEIAAILRHQKLRKAANLVAEDLDPDVDPNSAEGRKLAAKAHAIALKNMIIPLAPNATTFEALTRAVAECASPMWITTMVKGKPERRPSFHSSLCVHLEEMGSLFRKHSEDIHTLLCELYDCKEEYEYRTKHQGTDLIRRPCMNILAGTTPDFLKRVFSSSLLSEGFASRTSFIVAFKNRFRRYDPPVFTPEQLAERELMIDHIAALTKLIGQATFTPEAKEYGKALWERDDFDTQRRNPNPKLNPYYARWQITHQKLTMAIHFGESLDMNVGVNAAIHAHKMMGEAEESMHLALQYDSKNPLTTATDNILKYFVMHKRANKKLLIKTFYDDMPNPYEDVNAILKYLEDTGRVTPTNPAGTYELIES